MIGFALLYNLTVDDTQTLARLKALADPARLRLVRILAELPDDHTLLDPRCGTVHGACFCHLEERLGLAAATVSHHLKVLRQAGLIEVVRVGKWSYYRLLPHGIEHLIKDVTALRPTSKLIQLEVANS